MCSCVLCILMYYLPSNIWLYNFAVSISKDKSVCIFCSASRLKFKGCGLPKHLNSPSGQKLVFPLRNYLVLISQFSLVAGVY